MGILLRKHAKWILLLAWACPAWATAPGAQGPCVAADSSSAIEKLVGDLSALSGTPKASPGSETVELGHHLRAVGCARYPGGIVGLTRDVTSALSQGLACFSRLGPARKADVASILRLLEPGQGKELRLICDQPPGLSDEMRGHDFLLLDDGIAHGISPKEPLGPAIVYDTRAVARTPDQRPHITFHELLHVLGYEHASGIDVNYLSDICCFDLPGVTGQRKREMACKLLKENPSWTRAKYQSRFAELMATSGRHLIAADSAWYAMWGSSLMADDAGRGHANPLPLYRAMLSMGSSPDLARDPAMARDTGVAMTAAILGGAALDALPVQERKQLQGAFTQKVVDRFYPQTDSRLARERSFAVQFAEVLGDYIRKDFPRARKAATELEKKDPDILEQVTPGEAQAISGINQLLAFTIKTGGWSR